MPNQLIFFVTAVVDLFFILSMVRLGKSGLEAAIVTNLILVSTFGGLLIPLFGQVTKANFTPEEMVDFVAKSLAEPSPEEKKA